MNKCFFFITHPVVAQQDAQHLPHHLVLGEGLVRLSDTSKNFLVVNNLKRR